MSFVDKAKTAEMSKGQITTAVDFVLRRCLSGKVRDLQLLFCHIHLGFPFLYFGKYLYEMKTKIIMKSKLTELSSSFSALRRPCYIYQ